MSERPDGGAIAGILTGALLGVTVAMAISPVKPILKRGRGELFERGKAILDTAASGLEEQAPGPGPFPTSPGV